ncbi:ABC transporter ATP-binding protein [Xinfangfangia sp. CPCC 101601]|uniref:ABC transporter ATP-binding protein n=1 Tax=Pseudogemmobacter lacusdianii TaxID=3069608 RepID=A0ABU0W3V6_9RHOB|nr:ABC transporter ATP-binding protein [Xinfangfangia sp. CPCC 101601]MDQ2067755.1 ABC transporter ATP-binding protein [Xinfangfangia sp. CPCC 101601]
MSTPIHLGAITKSFNGKPALSGIDLDIAQGEMIALLGASGCGKTTLLRIIAGLEQPSSGQIHFGTRDVTDLSVQARRIGMVFQGYALFPNMTVRQNIGFPLKIAGESASAITARVNELLEMTGLGPRGDHHPNQLSGGQQQRTALARALAPRPDVLLLDEPLSALDAQVRDHLRDEIARIQKTVGTTTVLVTHDQAEAMAIADRVVIMHEGRVEQASRPEALYEMPASGYTASFIGTRNRFDVSPQGGELRIGGFFRQAAANSAAHQVWVRAEALRIVPAGQGLAVTVEAKLFQGPITRLYLTCHADGLSQTLKLDAPSEGLRGVEPGQSLHVTFDQESADVFAA